MVELPNRLFSDGRSVLAKFGYRHLDQGASRDDWADMWEHLKADFTAASGGELAAFDALPGDVRAAAQEYMRCRLIADRNLDACEDLHVRLFSGGIKTDAVEAYSQAREVYEDSVEAFGHAREKVEKLIKTMDS